MGKTFLTVLYVWYLFPKILSNSLPDITFGDRLVSISPRLLVDCHRVLPFEWEILTRVVAVFARLHVPVYAIRILPPSIVRHNLTVEHTVVVVLLLLTGLKMYTH